MAAAQDPQRARYERERLARARDLLAEVQKHYRPDRKGAAPNQTLNALIAHIEVTPSEAVAG